ncbi:MAG: M20/M25/M40 family metallo-hydrolase [Lachnospiraceae bacterium]
MDAVEERIIQIISDNKERIFTFAREIFANPQPGFQEDKTAALAALKFKELQLPVREHLAKTGVRADSFRNKGPTVALIGEMDAIMCPSHPFADSTTKVAHACGHHAQMAAVYGAAIALMDAQIREQLDGNLSFFAVPAEEYIDAAKREVLRDEDGIVFAGSGKSELVRLGEFDSISIGLTTHVHMLPVQEDLLLGNVACNGFTPKNVTVHGRTAHAAIAPWEGVNALSIATSALQMIGLMREGFNDEEKIRVHSVIRKGGDALNSIPEEVILEEKVRAKSLEAIVETGKKVDAAFHGAAYAFGGEAEIENLQGYLPVLYRAADPALIAAGNCLREYSGTTSQYVQESMHNAASTDVGDLTHLMPILNFTHGGFSGALHGADFAITDEEKAYLVPAQMMALTAYHLLKEQAVQAKTIVEDFVPKLSKEEYIAHIIKNTGQTNAPRV